MAERELKYTTDKAADWLKYTTEKAADWSKYTTDKAACWSKYTTDKVAELDRKQFFFKIFPPDYQGKKNR